MDIPSANHDPKKLEKVTKFLLKIPVDSYQLGNTCARKNHSQLFFTKCIRFSTGQNKPVRNSYSISLRYTVKCFLI